MQIKTVCKICHQSVSVNQERKHNKTFQSPEIKAGRFLFNYLSIFIWQLKGSDKQMIGMPRAGGKSEQNFNDGSPSACINFY